jgi:hypothetical protein
VKPAGVLDPTGSALSDSAASQSGDALLDFLLLSVFLLFNFFVLRWVARRLVVETEWLRDPEEREEVLREFGLDRVREHLFSSHRTGSWRNPMNQLLVLLGLIAGILWADYTTIRQQWPWLLGG